MMILKTAVDRTVCGKGWVWNLSIPDEATDPFVLT